MFLGGSTFCAVATLSMLGRLHDETVLSRTDLKKLKRWCVFRQNEGFFGRPNKPDDSCYTFWISATLKVIFAYIKIMYTYLSEYVA